MLKIYTKEILQEWRKKEHPQDAIDWRKELERAMNGTEAAMTNIRDGDIGAAMTALMIVSECANFLLKEYKS